MTEIFIQWFLKQAPCALLFSYHDSFTHILHSLLGIHALMVLGGRSRGILPASFKAFPTSQLPATPAHGAFWQ